MEKTFHMLLYRAFHAQRSCLRPHVARLGLGAGQPKLLWYLAGTALPPAGAGGIFRNRPRRCVPHAGFLGKGRLCCAQRAAGRPPADVVRLTEKGGAACAEWQECCRALERKMLQGFTRREAEQFSEYLARAYRNLRGKGL